MNAECMFCRAPATRIMERSEPGQPGDRITVCSRCEPEGEWIEHSLEVVPMPRTEASS